MPRKPLRSGELARMIAQCGGQKLVRVAAHRQVLRFGVGTPLFVPGECEGAASDPHRRHGDGLNRSQELPTVAIFCAVFLRSELRISTPKGQQTEQDSAAASRLDCVTPLKSAVI